MQNKFLTPFFKGFFILLLLFAGIGNAWGESHSTHTATLNVAKGTGSGTVYASTSGSATSGSASASFNCGGNENGQHTGTLYAYATPASGYTFLGWTTSASSSAGADNSNPKGVAFDVSSANSSQTLYAHFVEKAKVNITFEAPYNGTYTIAVNGGSAETVSSADVVKNNVEGVVLTATPASGYAFAGWYKLNSAGEFVEDLSIASPYNASFTTSETIKMGARFVPTTLGKFILKGSDTQYYGLKMATIAAGGSGTIVPVADETLVDGSDLMPFDNGTYNIKAGATLLVPYSSANTVQTAPQIITTAATLSAYKTLVFTDGVNVECDGTICVGGQIMAGSGGAMSGYVSGPCGMINMANGGHIELNSGAKLYCWGFIKGQDMDQGNNTVGVGTITANSGAEVWENLGIGDWRGGKATSNIKNTRFFPFQSYFIQNIEVPLTIEYGAAEKNYIALNATGGPYNTSATTIGSSKALFLLKDANSAFRKWYDPTTDLTCFELSGTSQIDALAIKISASGFNIDVNSADFDLPINSSMHIILTNSSVTLSKPMVLQPGAVIEVKNDADITLSSNAYLYDKDNWGAYAGPSYYFHSYPNLTSHKNRGDGKSNALLDDAKVIVDGTVSVTGKLYSTAAGANVMGNGGGKIVFSTGLPTATTIPAFTGNGDAVSGGVAVNSANLCNEDESYTKSIASTTFHNVNGRWFKSGNQNENADHTYNFTYIASGAVSGTGGTDVSPNTHNAVYAPDKTGLTAGMKWCNVAQDGTCSNIFNATQALNETPASDIRYTYPSDSWLQLLRTETEGVYGGSDNSLYAVEGCAVNSLGSVDENCLYTINDIKKALVDGHFVALEKNTEDEAWHDVANPTNYYICFEGCNWHPATKYAGEEKAYIVEGGDYIWYNNDWLLVEREDPFFFDYNEQNVKRYYEYENGEWVLADPKVRVTDAIETRDFIFLSDAINVASAKKNATITILKDISGINSEMTFTAANTTCTLDLNGHTVSGACAKLLTINAAGSTFTITDNSEEKDGRLENVFNQNATTYTVTVTSGTLNLNAGTIYVENPAQYAAKVNAATGITAVLTSCAARAIQVAAAQKLNVTGGRVESHATRNAYGIVATGNAANTTLVTVSGGTIYAEAPYGAYGINSSGKLNVSGGTIEGHLNTAWADGQYTQGSNNDRNAHQYAYGINMTASSNATAGNCYFGTLTMTGGTVQATSAWDASYTCYAYGVRIQKALTAVADASKTADGTHSQKASAIGSITGGTISVDIKGNYAYGVFVEGNYNSYNKKSNTFHISGAAITSKAKNYAYGVYANASIDGTCGGYHYGIVKLDNSIVTARTTAAYAYAVYVASTSSTIFQDKQANYYGEYATAAEMTINSGTYTAVAGSSTAYAATSSTCSKSTYNPATSVETERTPGGNAEAYAKLTIHGGTFSGEATTTTSRAVSSGGITIIDGGTFEAYSASTTAYGLYAVSGKLTATGVTVTASATGTAYGAFADAGIPNGNTAQTGFAYSGELELKNCNITATTRTSTEARGVFVNTATRIYNWTQFQKDSTSNKWATATYNAYKSVFPCTVEGRDSVGIAMAAKATINGGTITATAATTTAYGVYSVNAFTANLDSIATPDLVVRNATITAKTNGTTTAYGIYAQGETTVDGCDITVQPKTTTGYGIMALNYKDTVRVSNTTVRVTTTHPTSSTSDATAYGIYGYVDINATNGLERHGNFILGEGNDVTSTITSGKTSYAVFLNATKRAITTTGGDYRPGDYATAATAIINGGEYNATATSGAYALVMQGKQTQGSVTAAPQVTVNGGKFNGKTAETGTGGLVGYEQLLGGYYVHNTNLAKYAVAPKSVWTLPTTHEEYANGYRYKIAEIYTLKWETDGDALTGTYSNGITEAGSAITAPATPTKTGYTFAVWTPEYTGTMPSENTTYTATWTINSHNLTWDANGGVLSGNYTSGSLNYGTAIVAPTATRENFVFNGWNTAGGAAATTMPDEDLTYTAQWIPAVASVTINGTTTYYATIAAAFTAANNATAASTLTLLQDVTVTTKLTYNNSNNKDCILDLNGHTLTSNTSEQSPLHINNTSVTFTITDGTVEKAGKLSLNSSFSTRAIFGVYVQLGTLLLNAGTIEVTSSTANTCGVTADQNGIFTMNGGTIHVKNTNGSKEGRGVYLAGSVSINGGTVHVEAAGTAYGIRRENTINSSTITINDGKFNVIGSTAYATNQESANSKVVIRGGYYTTNNQLNPTAPYHVFGLDNQSPYLYEVAEGYTLTWTTDGDPLTGTYTSGVTKPGTTIVEPATPIKTGYTFSAWSPAVAAAMPAENTEYTATWTPNTNTAYIVNHYQENLDGTYPSTPADTENLTGTTDASVTPAVKTYDGFTAPGTQTTTILPDGSLVVEYKYTRNSYQLTWDVNGGTISVAGTAAGLVKHGATITAPTVGRTGYNFMGWTPAVPSTMPIDGVTCTAHWDIIPYDISYTLDGGIVASANPTTYNIETATFTLNNPTKEGYTFLGWTGSNGSTPQTAVSIANGSTGDKNYTANWAVNVASVTVNSTTTYYTSFADAWTAANSATAASTLTLLQDISGLSSSRTYSASHDLTLDLNGHTLSGSGTITSLFKISCTGYTFTITDGSANHDGKVSFTAESTSNSYCVIVNNGTFVLEAGMMKATSSTVSIGAVQVVGGMFTMNENGAVHVNYTGNVDSKNSRLVHANGGTTTINGGSIRLESKKDAIGVVYSSGNVTFNGGLFNISASCNAAVTNQNVANNDLNIRGGYYSANMTGYFEPHVKTPYHRFSNSDATYIYRVAEAYTVTFKNGDVTLQSGLWEKGATPLYSGETPAKAADAQYTYTFDGWSTTDGGDKLAELPAVSANATYFAHFARTENKYTVAVAAGANGSVSPASVSEIGCETASADITATPDAGYSFNGWTLPDGVTAADGYTVASNPIRIHAIAASKTITANFVARNDINYTVKHWQQNIADDDYTEVTADQETKQGTTATLTAATAKTYTGFTALPITQETIAGDGTTVVKIYYDRNTHTVTWTNGDDVIKTDENVRFGATPAYNGSTPTKDDDGTYTYSFRGWAAEGNDEIISTFPAITGNATYVAQYTAIPLVITVEDEQVVTVDATITEINVKTDGSLTIDDNATLTTDDLVLEATEQASGELVTNNANITVSRNAHFDWTINAQRRRWYAVAVPWQVDAENGIALKQQGKTTYTHLILGRNFDLLYYDEATRATNGANKTAWKYVEDDNEKTMLPGRLYIIAFDRTYGDNTTIRFTKKAGAELVFTGTINVNRSNETGEAGWNGIANPALFKAYLNAGITKGQVLADGDMDNGTRYATIILNDSAEGKLPVGKPVFIQRTSESSETAVVNRTAYKPASAPVRRMAAANTYPEMQVRIGKNNAQYDDRIFLNVTDNKPQQYIAGQDLAKMGTSKKYLQMWIDRYDKKLCVNTTDWNDDMATYPLGIYAPAAGEYLLQLMPTAAHNMTAYLTYEGEVIARLDDNGIMLQLNKGNNNAYGIRLVRTENNTVTALDEAKALGEDVTKILYKGNIYIVREGKVYDLQGSQVK